MDPPNKKSSQPRQFSLQALALNQHHSGMGLGWAVKSSSWSCPLFLYQSEDRAFCYLTPALAVSSGSILFGAVAVCRGLSLTRKYGRSSRNALAPQKLSAA